MMVNIANPVYGTVRAYLMQDEQIAQILNTNNRLDDIINMFDQNQINQLNNQVLTINIEKFYGDKDMMLILHKLMNAASDYKLRQDMNVEDEFYAPIKNRDRIIQELDKKIKEQEKMLQEQNKKIKERNK